MYLLIGTHFFITDIREFASVGAAIPLIAGVTIGPLLLMILHRTGRSRAGLIGIVTLTVIAVVTSWIIAAAVAGSDAEAARIPAFFIGILGGSVTLRLIDERYRMVR
ncbi:hypothetical protein [Halobiforma nitratireducens]|uniref:Uncharacterized protein n=1 Tax=Halobiforma nitratireducens JCM 10879 TaxID=1227454 RepID=M0MGY4_9EURY|nr:hypothetical protein [Halobiforma nitratireducens]EMA43959.1 hypothetical protein C446_03099 [Halobiforma nitratireducens JCM 10879]